MAAGAVQRNVLGTHGIFCGSPSSGPRRIGRAGQGRYYRQAVHAHVCLLDSRVVQCVWPTVPDMDCSIVNLPPRHRFEPAIQPSSHPATKP